MGLDGAGMWCRDNAAMCPLLWWCDIGGISWSTFVGCCFWSGLFVILCLLLWPVASKIHRTWPSKFEEEQQVSWLVLHVQSTLHACCVASLAAGALWELSSADPRAQLDAPSAAFPQHHDATARIAKASHIFFCYTIVDIPVTFYRKSMTFDYFLHHMVFIFFCVLIQYDCFAGYVAGWLMIMEFSTIFLNGFTYWRNRLGYENWIVRVFFILFALTFLAFRLVGTSYIAYYWARVVLEESVPFDGIPRWHLHILCVALIGAVFLQVFWAAGIAMKFIRVLSPTTGKAEKSS